MGLSTGVQTAVGKFVWHENHSTDVQKAKDFYTQLFGWETETWKPGEIDYPMIKVGEQMHGGFNAAQGDAPSHWLGHVLVQDVDETVRRAEAAGGNIAAGPMDMPEIGRFALIADPQGATISLYSPEGEAPISEGTFVWDELLTTDVDGAKSFYTEVIGWTTRDMDMGDQGTYTIFQRAGEVDVAGMMARPEGVEAPPHWLPYIAADDVDATVAKAKELGGNAFMEGTDIPNVGRIAVLQDPVGAVFGLFKPSEA
jgi:predicted enzyme related to lactoylglutathione lyase